MLVLLNIVGRFGDTTKDLLLLELRGNWKDFLLIKWKNYRAEPNIEYLMWNDQKQF